jgi:uncharacterized small protein (DUF1192 family)
MEQAAPEEFCAAFALRAMMAGRKPQRPPMDLDDLIPPKKPAAELTTLSIEELENRIAELQAEIAQLRHLIEAKRAHKGSAEGLFRR